MNIPKHNVVAATDSITFPMPAMGVSNASRGGTMPHHIMEWLGSSYFLFHTANLTGCGAEHFPEGPEPVCWVGGVQQVWFRPKS